MMGIPIGAYGYPSVRNLRLAGSLGGPQVQTHYITTSCKIDARVLAPVKLMTNAAVNAMELAGLFEETVSESLTYTHSALNAHDVRYHTL